MTKASAVSQTLADADGDTGKISGRSLLLPGHQCEPEAHLDRVTRTRGSGTHIMQMRR
jgi:hypothetical protein